MTERGWEAGDYLLRPLHELIDDTVGQAVPAAGSAAAATAALAAALVAKIARRSRSRRPDADELVARTDDLLGRLKPQITEDAAVYAAVFGDRGAVALEAASVVPRVVAEAATAVAELAADLAETGNPNLRHDALAAERLARTAADVAASLVAANAGTDRSPPPR